jgi:hypothetical protein
VELAASVGVLLVKVAGGDEIVDSAVGLALSVDEGSEVEGLKSIVLVGRGTVTIGASDCGTAVWGSCFKKRNKKRINRMIAMINLKRSYPGARADVFMASP